MDVFCDSHDLFKNRMAKIELAEVVWLLIHIVEINRTLKFHTVTWRSIYDRVNALVFQISLVWLVTEARMILYTQIEVDLMMWGDFGDAWNCSLFNLYYIYCMPLLLVFQFWVPDLCTIYSSDRMSQ